VNPALVKAELVTSLHLQLRGNQFALSAVDLLQVEGNRLIGQSALLDNRSQVPPDLFTSCDFQIVGSSSGVDFGQQVKHFLDKGLVVEGVQPDRTIWLYHSGPKDQRSAGRRLLDH